MPSSTRMNNHVSVVHYDHHQQLIRSKKRSFRKAVIFLASTVTVLDVSFALTAANNPKAKGMKVPTNKYKGKDTFYHNARNTKVSLSLTRSAMEGNDPSSLRKNHAVLPPLPSRQEVDQDREFYETDMSTTATGTIRSDSFSPETNRKSSESPLTQKRQWNNNSGSNQKQRTMKRKDDNTFHDATSAHTKSNELSQERRLPKNIPQLSDLLRDNSNGDSRKINHNHNYQKKARNANANANANANRPRRDRSHTIAWKGEPWKANYKTSIRTQGRLKKEFSTSHKGESPNDKAKRILQALLVTNPTQCNAANVVGALTFSAKALGSRHMTKDETLQELLFQTLDILHQLVHKRLLSTRQLCNACWAIAKHYDRDDELLLPPPTMIGLSSDDAFGTAEQWNLVDNTTKVGQQTRVDETVDEIASQLTDILDEAEGFILANGDKPQKAKIGEICMACWAYGKLRHRKTPPGWELPPQVGKFPETKDTVQSNTDIITFERWGSFGIQDLDANDGDDDDIQKKDRSTDSVTDLLFDVIGSALCQRPEISTGTESRDVSKTYLQDCTWSELANVGWSYASHGRCKSKESEALLQNLAREACRRLDHGGEFVRGLLVRDVAQLLWALGTLQTDNFRLAEDLVHLVGALSDHLRVGEKSPAFGRRRNLSRWSSADLVQVALSLAHARIDEMPLLRAIYEESHHRLLEGAHSESYNQGERQTFRPWEVSILLWAQARLHLHEEQGEVFEEFVADAPKFLLSSLHGKSLKESGIGPQEQANIAWSLTVLEETHSRDAVELIDKIFQESVEACSEQNSIQLEHAHQLWQAYFLLEEESPKCIENVPLWFADYLKEKWSVEKARGKRSSARHRSLSQTLDFMGIRHFNEHDEDIDVAIVLKSDASWTHETDSYGVDPNGQVSVAVEFDGPNHFTREKYGVDSSSPPRALGHTVLKYRLLKKQGWRVVRVPYFEFDKIPFWASMERQRYLQRKLKTHANIKFSEVDISEYKALGPKKESRFD